MSELRIFAETNPAKAEATFTQFEPIRDQLAFHVPECFGTLELA